MTDDPIRDAHRHLAKQDAWEKLCEQAAQELEEEGDTQTYLAEHHAVTLAVVLKGAGVAMPNQPEPTPLEYGKAIHDLSKAVEGLITRRAEQMERRNQEARIWTWGLSIRGAA